MKIALTLAMLALFLFYLLVLFWPKLWQSIFKQLSLQRVHPLGEELLLQIRSLSFDTSHSNTLTDYKYYSLIVQKLIFFRRKFGSHIQSGLNDLREGLKRDIRFERVLRGLNNAGQGQMLLISLSTWGFIYISSQYSGFSRITAFKVFALQGGGFLTYLLVFNYLKKKRLGFYGEFFSSLYSLLSLVSVGISPTKALAEAKVGRLFNQPNLPFIKRRLEKSLSIWRLKGVPIQEELKSIIEELWSYQEESFKSFSTQILILRFSVLVSFFLAAYFLYLFSIFDGVMGT